MKKGIFTLLLALFVMSFTANGQKRGKGIMGDVTEALLSDSEDIAFRETFEQFVVEWALREELFKSGDLVEIKMLVGVQKSEANAASSMLFRYKVNERPSEIVMIVLSPNWWNENGVVYSKMKVAKIERELLEDIVFTLVESSAKSGFTSRPEEGLIVKASKEITGQGANGERIESVSEKEFKVRLRNIKAINAKKIRFNVPAPYNVADISLRYLNSDQHIFAQMRNENYILDYTERSINLYNKTTKNHLRIYNANLELIIKEILK